jgi:hypothetical protein
MASNKKPIRPEIKARVHAALDSMGVAREQAQRVYARINAVQSGSLLQGSGYGWNPWTVAAAVLDPNLTVEDIRTAFARSA